MPLSPKPWSELMKTSENESSGAGRGFIMKFNLCSVISNIAYQLIISKNRNLLFYSFFAASTAHTFVKRLGRIESRGEVSKGPEEAAGWTRRDLLCHIFEPERPGFWICSAGRGFCCFFQEGPPESCRVSHRPPLLWNQWALHTCMCWTPWWWPFWGWFP